jgi:hypothetical protein
MNFLSSLCLAKQQYVFFFFTMNIINAIVYSLRGAHFKRNSSLEHSFELSMENIILLIEAHDVLFFVLCKILIVLAE